MRRWWISLGLFFAAVLLLLALLPFWLGAALHAFGPRFGVTCGPYERAGYCAFRVHDVVYQRKNVRVTVETVATNTPVWWLTQRATGRAPLVRAGRWTVNVGPSITPERTPAAPSGWVPLHRLLGHIASGLAEWLPAADVGAGDVRWPSGGLTLASARWRNRTITTPDLAYRVLHASAEVHFTVDGAIEASARDTANALALALHSRGAEIDGELRWRDQPIALSARFAATGWRPDEAHASAREWRVPAEQIKLGAQYAFVAGHAAIDWKDGALRADVAAHGAPKTGSHAPALDVTLRGHGENDVFVAEAADVELPGISAHLTEPVTIDRTGHLRSPPARFVARARLDQLPWFSARGTADGDGQIAAGTAGIASIAFTVRAQAVAIGHLELSGADVHGRFEWPRLTIDDARIRAGSGGELVASGGWDFRNRELLPAHVSGTIVHALLAPWLPPAVRFDTATVDASGQGVWPTLQHQGSIEVKALALPTLQPMSARLSWDAVGFDARRVGLRADLPDGHLEASGTAETDGVVLRTLELRPNGAEPLTLQQPAQLRWRPTLRSEPLVLSGGGVQINAAFDWARVGLLSLRATHVSSDLLRTILVIPATRWQADRIELQANWANGPANFDGTAAVSVPLGTARLAQVNAQFHGDGRGLAITGLDVAEGSGTIVHATGRVPVIFRPGQQPLMQVRLDGPFTLNAATQPNPEFWDKLTQLTGVEIVKPQALVRLEGTLQRPRGEVQLRADRIAPVPGRFTFPWPRIEGINVHLAGEEAGVKLESFTVSVDGQTVQAEGEIPVDASHWFSLIRDPRSIADHGRLHVIVPDADLAAVAPYVPNYLAPTGRLQLDLTMNSDRTVQGFVKVHDATTRPLGPLGVLQEVGADVRFEGRTVRLQQVNARMGGQLVTLQGTADLPAYEAPRLNFTLRGENLPFLRRTGLLVRGDLDLALKTLADGRTEIGGDVHLRDSLFLADVRSLLPSGSKPSERRPPYFAIDTPPLNAWRIAVTVHGERFLRLRTPVFNGTASARIRIDGVLANPGATGQAVIDEGNVRLPFATFEVKQGEIRLTPDQPEPQLMITGTTRRYGYDLRMEVTGAASSPNLTFTSSPPLEAEQVLLMVMAGQAPHNEIATTDRQRAARFGAFFGQSILGGLTGGGGADRLTISSGEDISQQGRETYSIEYKLNEKWSLTGEYDQFDEYNGGVKWRFYQKGGTRDKP